MKHKTAKNIIKKLEGLLVKSGDCNDNLRRVETSKQSIEDKIKLLDNNIRFNKQAAADARKRADKLELSSSKLSEKKKVFEDRLVKKDKRLSKLLKERERIDESLSSIKADYDKARELIGESTDDKNNNHPDVFNLINNKVIMRLDGNE